MGTAHGGRQTSLIRVLRLLHRCGGNRYAPPLKQLADEFHVSTRTIRRDFEVLEYVGCRIPRYTDFYTKPYRRSG